MDNNFKIKGIKQVLFLLLYFSINHSQAQNRQPVDFVNPFIGASTSISASGDASGLGKTFPGAATPFGMTQVSPLELVMGNTPNKNGEQENRMNL